MRKLLIAVVLLAVFAVIVLPRAIEAALNRARTKPPYPTQPWARDDVAGSVDLHADPLLWGRNLLKRGAWGQTDVPRLQEAQVALQVFGVVTQAPALMRTVHNPDRSPDLVTALSVVSLWPWRTVTSRRERALYQAERLRRMAEQSNGALMMVRSAADLEMLLQLRSHGAKTVGALLALEGSQALEGDLTAIDALYDAGFRMMSPAHFVDTEIGGSAHGEHSGGLTPLGRQWLAKLEQRGILVDVAHASPRAIDDVLSLAKRPVVVSHTGVKATCDTARNLSDAQLKALAKNGALVGIGYFKEAVCGTDAQAIARAMRHAADVMGVSHVALGSDFDGAVATPFDVTGLPLLAEALRAQKFTDAEIRAIASENALRFLADMLMGTR